MVSQSETSSVAVKTQQAVWTNIKPTMILDSEIVSFPAALIKMFWQKKLMKQRVYFCSKFEYLGNHDKEKNSRKTVSRQSHHIQN